MLLKSYDGTKIYYRIKRKSRLFLVFIHGWGVNWTVWEKEIAFFQRKGYSTVALDLRGHGQSGKPESKGRYSFNAFAKDINAIIKKEKIGQIVLIGHSMGGMVALKYCQLFSRSVKAMVLCDTTFKNVLAHKRLYLLSPFVKHVLEFLISHEDINQKHFRHMRDIDLTAYRHSSDYRIFLEGLHNAPLKSVFAALEDMLSFDATGVIESLKVPVLIIEGKRDKLLPQIDSFEMYKEIKNAEMDFIPKGRHFVNLEYPGLVDRYIFNFLTKHELKPE